MCFRERDGLAAIKECRAYRNRVGAVIRALMKLVEHLEKDSKDVEKQSVLEDRVAKATAEVIKTKEQRKASDEKRALAAEKEKLRIEKQRDREEEAERKKEAAAAALLNTAGVKRKSGVKEDESLVKSSNFMLNFVRKVGTPGAQETAGAHISISAEENVISESSSGVGFDVASFDESVRGGGMGTSPLFLCKSATKTPRFRRKPIQLIVNADSSAFSPECVQMKEVTVDSRLRLLSFADDLRPPYFGTFSKAFRKMAIVSGRRPFTMDTALFNYDYDSEAEWEEEDEGEDIAESMAGDEDMGEEGNELIFDDFLLHDNDYGSDVDSDGEGIAVMPSIRRQFGIEREVLGPRFFLSREVAFKLTDGSVQAFYTSEEKDSTRLQSHTTVFHKNALPILSCQVVETSPENAALLEQTVQSEEAGVPVERKSLKPSKKMEYDDIRALAGHVHGQKESLEKLVSLFLVKFPDFNKVIFFCHTLNMFFH